MFYQIFLSSQLKRYAIITYKHGISLILAENSWKTEIRKTFPVVRYLT